IVEAVIDLSHALGLRVIAEGIEEIGQGEILVRMGADQAQGFHFGRPEPADVVEAKFNTPWCGATAPDAPIGADHRADELPGFGSVRGAVRAATTEVAMRRADGTTFPCELTLSPISDERGVHTHWLYVRRDLTQRRATEGDRSRFQSLIDQSSSLVFIAESGG